MSEWKEVNLKGIIDSANTGLDAIKRAPIVLEDTGIKCLRIQDISQGKDFNHWGFTNVEQKNYQKFRLRKDDIIIARTGNTIGVNRFFETDQSSVFNNGLIRLRVNKEKAYPKYVFYNLRTKYFKDFIDSISGGTSTQPNMQIEALLTLDLLLPPLPEQESIAEVLSSLDDKIDLLHRNNKTLEQLAETLFRQWFVKEAEECKLSDEFNVTMGQSPPGETYNDIENGIIFYQGRTDFGFRFPNPRVYCTHPTRFAEPFDTLMSVRAPVGDINYASVKCCIGRGIAAIRHKNKEVHHSYTYYLMKHLRSDFDVHEDTGTIFGSINKEELLSIKCPKLDINNVSYFNSTIGTIDDKIVSNCDQIQQLEILRDTLLPKLMSGVVRVEN